MELFRNVGGSVVAEWQRFLKTYHQMVILGFAKMRI